MNFHVFELKNLKKKKKNGNLTPLGKKYLTNEFKKYETVFLILINYLFIMC